MAGNRVQEEWKAFPILEREENKCETCGLLKTEKGRFCCWLKFEP